MIIIFEGIDNVGKDTQIKLFQKYMFDKYMMNFHQLHYSGFSSDKIEKNELLDMNYKLYSEMFDLINKHDYNFILNRSHLGEYVYGNMYRGYDPSYIFDLEKTRMIKEIKLILLLDSSESVISRDDGHSFTTNIEVKKKEIELFKEVFNRTLIKDKILIEKNTIQNIQEQIRTFIER